MERVGGLQAQDPKAPYLGLWTRLGGFSREVLTRALRERRLVKATLMRATLHVVSARDYALLLPAVRPTLREYRRRDRAEVSDVEGLAARALAFASEPRTAAELRGLLGGDDAWWRVRFRAPFVHAPVGAEWAFGARPSFVAAETWLGRELESPPDVTHLLRRYLAAFGPAGLDDAAVWSGLPIATLREAARPLRLRRFQDERRRLLLDLPRAPRPSAETPAPPRLLPPFDNLVLSHADRTRVVSDEHRRIVIRGGLVDPVFLVDGFVAGRWRFADGAVQLEAFEALPRSVERDLRREGERLARFALG